MSEMMEFPKTWEEFEKSYGFDDSEEVYTNGSRLIPSFRVKQWLDHEENKRKYKQQATGASDFISRQDAIDELEKDRAKLDHIIKGLSGNDVRIDHYVAQHNQLDYDIDAIRNLPSALPCPEGFDPEHLTEQDKKDILDALDWVKGTITDEVPSAESDVPDTNVGNMINRQDAITSILQEADKLEGNGAIPMGQGARAMAFVVETLPSAQPEPCEFCRNRRLEDGDTLYISADWDGGIGFDYIRDIHYCPRCGRRLQMWKEIING